MVCHIAHISLQHGSLNSKKSVFPLKSGSWEYRKCFTKGNQWSYCFWSHKVEIWFTIRFTTWIFKAAVDGTQHLWTWFMAPSHGWDEWAALDEEYLVLPLWWACHGRANREHLFIQHLINIRLHGHAMLHSVYPITLCLWMKVLFPDWFFAPRLFP